MKFQFFIAVVALTLTAACGRPDFGTTEVEDKAVGTDVEREAPTTVNADRGAVNDGSFEGDDDSDNGGDSPDAEPSGGAGQVASDYPFGPYRSLAADNRSVVLAPHGLARSLVVAHAAAGPEEADAIASVVEPYLGGSIYSTFNFSDQEFERRETSTFGMVGGVWADESAETAEEGDFVDTLARHLGLGLFLLDFASAPEDARNTINNWHSTESEGRISEVVGPRSVSQSTRFLITDATWFSARWGFGGFDVDRTEYRAFRPTESDVQLPMMATDTTLLHVGGSDFDAVVMPFEAGFSLIAVLPDDLQAFEQRLAPEFLDRLVDEAAATEVSLEFPRIEVSDRVSLSSVADSMGLGLLFSDSAKYTAFADDTRLDDAHQRTRISFHEEGVEASSEPDAAEDDGATEQPPAEFAGVALTFDRPFFFAVRDGESGTYLFVGRVAQPQ